MQAFCRNFQRPTYPAVKRPLATNSVHVRSRGCRTLQLGSRAIDWVLASTKQSPQLCIAGSNVGQARTLSASTSCCTSLCLSLSVLLRQGFGKAPLLLQAALQKTSHAMKLPGLHPGFRGLLLTLRWGCRRSISLCRIRLPRRLAKAHAQRERARESDGTGNGETGREN